jgi:hypothetical protein
MTADPSNSHDPVTSPAIVTHELSQQAVKVRRMNEAIANQREDWRGGEIQIECAWCGEIVCLGMGADEATCPACLTGHVFSGDALPLARAA